MKSFLTISFFVTLLLTAGTAFSYQCDIPAPPPKIQPCACSLCQKQHYQCDQRQPCASRCGKCQKYKKTCNKKCNKGYTCDVPKKPCKKKVVQQNTYQCETTCCTTKTKHVTAVQPKQCCTQDPCGKMRCQPCKIPRPPQTDYPCQSQPKPCQVNKKQCVTQGCTTGHQETRWHTWFKNQG